MRDRFVTDQFVLDLSRISISYQEENPRFKDTFFTQFSMPFEFRMNADLRTKIGNYTDLNAIDLKRKHDGYHIVDGVVRKGILEILSVEGNLVQAQINSGFEQLPNFDKKLCDLPLLKKAVPNIYTHADEICRQKYPQTNYNFPRVAYPKNQNEQGWESFQQFLNHRKNGRFLDNNETAGDIISRNIMHPMPYLLYVLKVGFSDAGYELQGDVLTDEDFQQQLIYSATDYFSTTNQSEETLTLGNFVQKYVLENTAFGTFSAEKPIETAGTWRLVCDNIPIQTYGQDFLLRIKLGDITIREVSVSEQQKKLAFTQLLKVDSADAVTLSIEAEGAWQTGISFQLNIVTEHTQDGNVIPKIINVNEINLKRAVPDMTFGDLVRTIKNWKNYDMIIKDNRLYMNRIVVDEHKKMKDFRAFEVENPRKTFLAKRSYLIKFPEMDDKKFQIPSVFIDENGVQLSEEGKVDSDQIQINGYCLPLVTTNGHYTAFPVKQDEQTLGLIKYEGLKNGENNAEYADRLMPPKVSRYWADWYKDRIAASEFTWSFIANKNRFRHIGLRDTLYAYGQRFSIKSLSKNMLNKEFCQVEITLISQ
ncbi:MAG: hypothetical protein Q4A09_04950 [Capnocytophaga felis]|nr:hypothetical protein [Capnocytophaga felis]